MKSEQKYMEDVMKQQLKTEWERMINGRMFWISILVGCVISLVQIVMEVIPRALNILGGYSGRAGEPRSMYMYWMGMNYASPYKEIFLTILPILAMMPHALSYYMDCKSGYIKSVYTRTKRINYLSAKYIITFVSGGIVIIIPYLLNMLISACMLPALNPIRNGQYNSAADLFQELLYNKPMLYIAVYLVINFAFAGTFATIVLAFTYIIDNVFLISMTPFIIWYAFVIIRDSLVFKGIYFNINPICIVDMSEPVIIKAYDVIGTFLIVTIPTIVVYFANGVKSDVI